MPTPLPVPRVPPGFSPLTAASGQTACGTEAGDPIVHRTGAGGPTASPDGQTAHRTGSGGLTTSPGGETARGTGAGGPTARPYAAPSSPASPTSTVSRAPPATSAMPHAAPTTPAASPAAPASQLYPLHYSRRPRATWEPSAPPLHHQLPPAKAVPVAPPVNPHPMTTQVKRGFWPTDSPCRPLQHRPCVTPRVSKPHDYANHMFMRL
jgi:hypothetical protein